MFKTIRLVGCAATLLIFALVVIAMPKTALAENPQYCDSDIGDLTNPNFGSQVPVILVHGLSGSGDDWGSFASYINSVSEVAVAHQFEYDTISWWTGFSDAGSKLAKTIDCAARISESNGGYGKVIVVGYSQGGLVARQAASMQSTDGQRSIADQIGQVVTIGTPHNLGNAPAFPSQLIVHTIAGDVTKVYRDIQGNELRSNPQNSDLMVDVSVANSASTSNEATGGGQSTFACEKTYVKRPGWPNWFPDIDLAYTTSAAPCEHGQLITNTQNGVREDTALAIGRYVDLVTQVPSGTPLTIGSLTTYYDDENWIADYGAAGGGENGDILAVDKSIPVEPDDYMYYRKLFMVHGAAWGCNNTDCFSEHRTITGSASQITVGGRTSDSAVTYQQGTRRGIVWCFSEEYICIEYGQISPTQIYPSQALLELFETATWSD